MFDKPPANGSPFVLSFAVDRELEQMLRRASAPPVVCVRDLARGRRALEAPNPLAALFVCVEDGRDTSVELIRLARARWPRVPAVLFTRRPVNGSLSRLAEELVAEKLCGDGEDDGLVAELASRGSRFLRLREAQLGLAMVASARMGLTRRQSEIVTLLCLGVARKEIACRLGVSHSAVDQQLRKIFARFGEPDTTALLQRLTSMVLEESLQGARWLRRLGRHHSQT